MAANPAWKLDGVDLLPYLTSQEKGRPHAALYWRLAGQMAVRAGDWKLVRYDRAVEGGAGPSAARLYDLASDGGEATDLAARELGRVKELQAAWDAWDKGNVPALWGGGKADRRRPATHPPGDGPGQ